MCLPAQEITFDHRVIKSGYFNKIAYVKNNVK